MISVSWEGDKVILDMGRAHDYTLGKDLLAAKMSPLNAEKLADRLEEMAAAAERETPELLRGEIWEMGVTNYDKHVVLTWRLIHGDPKSQKRVPIPAHAARHIADFLRTNAHFAGHGLRIHFSKN